MKRFYKSAAAVPDEGGFAVALDGKPMNTPARKRLVAPTRTLADAVAAEWAAQDEEVKLATMRLTRLLATALDQILPDPTHAIGPIASYATSDLLCHRADAPADLRRRQDALWQPIVDWATLRYDAPLKVGSGVMPLNQSNQALTAIRLAVSEYDAYRLSGLLVATTASGSVLLALALAEGRIDVEQAWTAADVDESYQREQWGDDPLAARRRAEVEADLRAAARFLELLRD
ncbi:MAG: ATPase [Alphaproteobacteria bacterium]|nr:ATPase [Alphaproteobacteria bacterium]